MSYELFIRSYRDTDLSDLALSITLMSKVLNDRIFEAGAEMYQVKKEIIESIENLLDALKKIEEIDHHPL